jgi:methylenetetrahydrofolate dehydrogenase (NADP+)/methenyltetrahydrofolate cyclohydrolase
MCLKRNATVTICHSYTKDLENITKSADIIIVACGIPCFINSSHVRGGQVVVDVGIHKTEARLCGDVDFDNVKDIVSAITPVPGGVGPLTVVSLFQNLIDTQKS